MDLARRQPSSRSGANNTVSPISPSKTHSRSHRVGRRHHSSRGKQIRSLQIINLLLVLTLVAVFIGWINTWVNYNGARDEQLVLAAHLRQTRQELEQLQIRAKELDANLSTLVQQRLPSLEELRFDTTLPIDKDYVRNISFTHTGVDQKRQYEYSLVMENRSPDILKPNVRILLFDETGIQTGAAKITPEAATSNADLEYLEPAEIRAFSAAIPSDRQNPPKYFQVYLE